MNSKAGLQQKGPRLFAGVAVFFLSFFPASVWADGMRVEAVRFSGDIPFSEETASQRAGVEEGDAFSPELIQEASERLMYACLEHQYSLARVSWSASETPRGGMDVVFDFEPGPRGRLKQVRFTGHSALSADELRDVLRVKPETGLTARLLRGPLARFRRDPMQVEHLAADRVALLQRYRQEGYMEVEIDSAALEWAEPLNGFRITWPVLREGPVYSIGTIRFDADALPDEDTLSSIMRLSPGERANTTTIWTAAERVERYFQLRGHAFASVEVEIDAVEAERAVDLLFRARAGTHQTVRSVRFSGNVVTRDAIIERELAAQPGDVFDPAALQLTQARLAVLPMFSEVDLYYKGNRDAEALDVIIEVEEKKTGRVEGGFIYGEVEGGAFQLNIIEKNLALRPPFRGAALEGRLGLTVGSRIKRVDIDLENPRLRHSQWSLHGNVFYADSEFVSTFYDERNYGGMVLTGHPIGGGQILSGGYEAGFSELYDMDPVFAEQLEEYGVETDVRLTSAVLAWALDRRDRAFRTTRGARARGRLRAGHRALGGDADVIRSRWEAAGFMNPHAEHVIRVRADWRTVDAYGDTDEVPLPIRLFLGGPGDLRGFDYRSVAPRTADGLLIGGQSAWWTDAEYLLPLGRYFDLAAYVQGGDVSADAYSVSGEGPVGNWGVGLLVRADNFPVRFDYAVPFRTLDDDTINRAGRSRISFSAGYRY